MNTNDDASVNLCFDAGGTSRIVIDGEGVGFHQPLQHRPILDITITRELTPRQLRGLARALLMIAYWVEDYHKYD